ncbi:ABC transporter permease [Flavobacteriaceae bacterium Ap0902]|nr:ABC transporter permease [Flavobacteriaceae bacterium Ap0902]
MRQIWLVTQREFIVQVRKRSFILLTLLMPLLIVGLIGLVVFLTKANQETFNVAIVDETQLFSTTFRSSDTERYAFYPIEDLQGLKDTLADSEYLQGVLHIPATDSSFNNLKSEIELTSNKSMGLMQISTLEYKLSDRLEKLNLERKGLTEEELDNAKVPVNLQVIRETPEGASATSSMAERVKTILSYLLMYATFTFIMMYGVRVMRSVIEEKNNRVVEIIISSIKPFNMMLGKILGTTLVALTQFSIWIILILLAMTFIPSLLDSTMPPQDMMGEMANGVVPASFSTQINGVINTLFSLNYLLIIFTFLIYFFFGYLLYSAFFAAIGASVDNETETQQFMWVGLAPLILGVYGAISIIENPDGPVGFWMSMVPFTSPVAMMARISYGVPIWELILSIFILLFSVVIMVWFAAKIYKIGILMYGKKPSFKEWLKWIKY